MFFNQKDKNGETSFVITMVTHPLNKHDWESFLQTCNLVNSSANSEFSANSLFFVHLVNEKT